MADFNEHAMKRYEELLNLRNSLKTEIRTLRKLLENCGALTKVTRT